MEALDWTLILQWAVFVVCLNVVLVCYLIECYVICFGLGWVQRGFVAFGLLGSRLLCLFTICWLVFVIGVVVNFGTHLCCGLG